MRIEKQGGYDSDGLADVEGKERVRLQHAKVAFI